MRADFYTFVSVMLVLGGCPTDPGYVIGGVPAETSGRATSAAPAATAPSSATSPVTDGVEGMRPTTTAGPTPDTGSDATSGGDPDGTRTGGGPANTGQDRDDTGSSGGRLSGGLSTNGGFTSSVGFTSGGLTGLNLSGDFTSGSGSSDDESVTSTGGGSVSTSGTLGGASQDAGVTPTPGPGDATEGGAAGPKPILPPVESVDADGPFETTIDTGLSYWVFRPTDLGEDGRKHPVFIWGTGSGAVPSDYTFHFSRMASHGFVIVAPRPSLLSERHMTAALEWVLEENQREDGPYHDHLDPDRIGMGGHSQGSTSTFDAEAQTDRLRTTVHIAGGSLDGEGSSKVKTPTAYICGATDFALGNCRRDFENVEDQPTFFSILDDVGHVQCAREALPGMIAWLRWHLADETWRAAQFTGPDGEFFQGMWQSQTKNWER